MVITIKIGTMELKLAITQAHSADEKRILIKRLSNRLKNQFPVTVAEIGDFENLNVMELGLACIEVYDGLFEETMDRILLYIQKNTDTEFIGMKREIK